MSNVVSTLMFSLFVTRIDLLQRLLLEAIGSANHHLYQKGFSGYLFGSRLQ